MSLAMKNPRFLKRIKNKSNSRVIQSLKYVYINSHFVFCFFFTKKRLFNIFRSVIAIAIIKQIFDVSKHGILERKYEVFEVTLPKAAGIENSLKMILTSV